jgi:hypothetical protein
MCDLIDAELDRIDPAWRPHKEPDGRVVGVTYSIEFTRLSGGFETSVGGAGDRQQDYLDAIRRGTDEYERLEKLTD